MDRLQEACIVLKYGRKEVADCIASAVSPDNLIPGTDLVVETWSTEREVHCTVRCKRGLGSLLSTLDDLLSAIGVAEKTLRAMQGDSMNSL